jgi:FMN phosphatase YigB (HAD superfamily)
LHTDVAGAQGVGMAGVLVEVAHRPELRPDIVPQARIRELWELPDALSRILS